MKRIMITLVFAISIANISHAETGLSVSISTPDCCFSGAPLTITSVLTGFGSVTQYQWQQQRPDESWENIAGETNSALTIATFQWPDRAYRMLAVNLAGGTAHYGDTAYSCPLTIYNCSPVPVTFFTAIAQGNDVKIVWDVSDDVFQVHLESSRDGIRFIEEALLLEHPYVDKEVSGKIFYRLRIVHFNTQTTYSKVVSVRTDIDFHAPVVVSVITPHGATIKPSEEYPPMEFAQIMSKIINEVLVPGQYLIVLEQSGAKRVVSFIR